MKRKEGACLICGKPLIYFETAKELECQICHQKFKTYASCEDGHFVCDACHEERGVQVILSHCEKSEKKDPIAIMMEIMEDPYIYMHGPEHHILVGAALLTAYKNCGGELDFPAALAEMKERQPVPRRLLRPLGLLRSGRQHRHVYEYSYKSDAPHRKILGSRQCRDSAGIKRNRSPRRPAVLQAQLLYGGKGGCPLYKGTPWNRHGAPGNHPLRLFSGKQAVP